jgi:hypothetical protein
MVAQVVPESLARPAPTPRLQAQPVVPARPAAMVAQAVAAVTAAQRVLQVVSLE